MRLRFLLLKIKQVNLFFCLDKRVRFLNLGLGFKISHTVFNLSTFWMDRNNKELKRLLHDAKIIANRVEKEIKAVNADIVVTYEKLSDVMFKEYLKLDIPVVTMFHFNYDDVLKNRKLYYLFEKSDYLQVLTHNDLIETQKLIKKPKIVWIPNVAPQFEERAALNIKTIINIARVEPKQKRQHLLIEAFAKVANKYPDWKVEIYGDTGFNKKYYSECCQLIEKHNLQNRVFFCGTTKDVKAKLLNSAIFAFPSAYEGFGIALAEALSAGVPAIGYASCPGTNEVILNGESGILCDDGVDAFAVALDSLMGNEALRQKMGIAAKESMEQYAPDKVWSTWESLLEEAVSSKAQ